MKAERRARVVCHMLASEDGKVTGAFLTDPAAAEAKERYYALNRELESRQKPAAFAFSRDMMEKRLTGGFRPDLTSIKKGNVSSVDYLRVKGRLYAIAFDPLGDLGWKEPWTDDEDPGYRDAVIIEVLTKKTPRENLAYFQSIGVSYIFAGEEEIDLGLALYKLNKLRGIDEILLEGDEELNEAFFKEGLVDEISLVTVHLPGGAGAEVRFDDQRLGDFTLEESEYTEAYDWSLYERPREDYSEQRYSFPDIMEAFRQIKEGWELWFDRKTGEVICLSENPSRDTRSEEDIRWTISNNDAGRFIELPSREDLEEYGTMVNFVAEQFKDPDVKILEKAMEEPDPVAAFKKAVKKTKIKVLWDRFFEEELREHAISWCEWNDVFWY